MIMGLDKEKSGKLKLEITSSKEFMKKGKNLKTLTETNRKKFDKTKRDIIAKIATLMSRLPIICELGYETVEEIIENLPDNLFYGATKTEKEVLKLLVKEKVIDTYKVNLQLIR
jgi:signal recognition particle GTPase